MDNQYNEKPYDMADETVISKDGVNPVSRDEEADRAQNAYEDGIDIHFPGVVPPAYFPGFPAGPSTGGPGIG